jgi:hypothetical protein
MACSHIPTCPLFKHFQSNATLRSWKLMYCDSDLRSKNCERFKRSEGGETVAPNLLPNGKMIVLTPEPSKPVTATPSVEPQRVVSAQTAARPEVRPTPPQIGTGQIATRPAGISQPAVGAEPPRAGTIRPEVPPR